MMNPEPNPALPAPANSSRVLAVLQKAFGKQVWPIFFLAIASLFIATDTQAALTINSVTYTYGTQTNVATVYVPPSATITATVNLTVTANTVWDSTGWQVATAVGAWTFPSPATCDLAPTPATSGNGAKSTTLSITAPATANTYDGYFRASNNASTCAGTVSAVFTSTGGVFVDNTAPTIPTATIASNNANPAWAKTGDIVTLAFTVNDNSGLAGTGTPVVTISGVAATVAGTYPNFTATRTMLSTDTEGVVPFTINVSDKAGNAAAQRTVVTSGASVTFDRTAPTIPTATIASNNVPDTTLAYAGNIVTLTFTVNDTSGQVQTPVVTIGAGAASVSGAYPNFTATRTMTTADAQGTVTFTINVSDMPGNPATQRTAITSGSNVTFMKPPTATTNAASGITSAVATLNGTVSSNGTATTSISFEYGLTNAYGDSIAATPSSLLAGDANIPVSANLVGLNCNTPFHYRVVATNTGGTTYGLDGTFTTGVCSAPFSATACAATRFNGDLSCTFSDVRVTNIASASGNTSCVSGTSITLDLDLTVNFSTSARYDVGLFIANDGKSPTFLPVNGGAGSCSVNVLPITAPPFGYTFPDLDGVPQGTLDTCGDGSDTINGGTGSGVKRMSGVTLTCNTSSGSGGNLFAPFVVSWDNQKSPLGNLCTSNLYPVPNTAARCSAAPSTTAVNIVVLPVITKTNGGTTINPGTNTTYTVVISNNSGGPLQAATFTDPVVANLTVNSVSCAASGTTCPTTTVPLMQGAGIAIPSLPNGSSLTFTINATVSGAATPGSHIINTATVTIGVYTNSASDDDLIVVTPSAAKSFAPSTITEGAASVLTVTLTNPTVSAVTGVSFTDTYPANLFNAATANGSTTCGGTVTAANNGGSVALSGGTIPANGSCTVTVNVTSATASSYTNSTGPIAASSGTIPAASATLTVNLAVFGAFNACDVATVVTIPPNATCTNTTTSTNSRISTRLAGTAISLDLVALSTGGSRNTSYNNTVLVELLDASNNSGALDSYNCKSTWTLITTVSPNPAFAPTNNGIINVTFPAVPNAYRDVRVRVTNVGGPIKKGCSTDNFAIRPAAVTLLTTANASVTPPSASNTPTIAAGAAFTLYATTATGANYTGTLKLDTGKLTAQITSQDTSQQNGGTVGALTTGTCTPVNCIPTLTANPSPPSNNAGYSEVGYLYLGAGAFRDPDDDRYTKEDASGDCISDTTQYTNPLAPLVPDYLSDVLLANGKYGCSVGNKTQVSLGRFIPHHFGLAGTVVTRSELQLVEVQGTPFTYMGEPMKLSLVVTAYNKNEGTTQNYAGSFAKLDAATLGSANLGNWTCTVGTQCMGLSATSGATLLTSRLAIDTTSTNSTAPSNTTTQGGLTPGWGGGTSYFTLYSKFGRAAAPDGPYDILKIGGKPLDGDGVTLPPRISTDTAHCVNLDATTGAENAACDPGPTEANLRRKLFETMVRFGRLHLLNAYGSELLPMRVDARTEYWDGTRWTLNTVDALTTIPLNGVTASGGIAANTCFLTNPPPNSPTNAACLGGGSPITTFAGGLGRWVVFDKTTPQVGIADLNINLAAMPWLRGFWSSAVAGYIENPTARIKFGSPKAPFIYLREKY